MTDNVNDDSRKPDFKYYSTAEIAEMFGVQTYTIRLWIKKKKLRAIRVGNKLKVERAELVRFANERYVD